MKVRRIIMSLFGVILCGISVGILKTAALGVDPFQTLMAGLDFCISVDFGTLYVIVNALMLIFMILCDRHYIGIATFINIFFLGYVAEFSQRFLMSIFVHPVLIINCGLFLAGIILLCLSCSLYMTADLGVSTYDAIALIIANTWHKGRFKYVRILTDFFCVVSGTVIYFCAGGNFKGLIRFVGIGTIITAFFMGPLIDLFNEKISRRILGGKENA